MRIHRTVWPLFVAWILLPYVTLTDALCESETGTALITCVMNACYGNTVCSSVANPTFRTTSPSDAKSKAHFAMANAVGRLDSTITLPNPNSCANCDLYPHKNGDCFLYGAGRVWQAQSANTMAGQVNFCANPGTMYVGNTAYVNANPLLSVEFKLKIADVQVAGYSGPGTKFMEALEWLNGDPQNQYAIRRNLYSTSSFGDACTKANFAHVSYCDYQLCLTNSLSASDPGTAACQTYGAGIATAAQDVYHLTRGFYDFVPANGVQYGCNTLCTNALPRPTILNSGAYFFGVAKVQSEVYQCEAGYLKSAPGGVFSACQSDLRNQCVISATSPSGDPQGAEQYCSGQGTCSDDATRTAAYIAANGGNDIIKSCQCTSGYTPNSGTGVAYCSIPPCLDQWQVSQLASSCVGHGTCASPGGSDPYSCSCTGGYGGEVCQWPPSTSATVGPTGKPAQQHSIVFWYHGSLVRGTTVWAYAAPDTVYSTGYAFYSMRFSDGAQTKTLTESVSGVSTQLTIQDKCFVAAGNTPVIGSDVLLTLYGSTDAAATLQIAVAAQDAWVVACLKPTTGVNGATDPCRLPFSRSGISGSMQDVCTAPAASEVATLKFAGIGEVFCMVVPPTHWLASPAPTVNEAYYFCWTPFGYDAATPVSAGPTFAAFPDAAKTDVFCLFRASSLLWSIMIVPNARSQWFHVYQAMRTEQCI
jgi:hypothetical protein